MDIKAEILKEPSKVILPDFDKNGYGVLIFKKDDCLYYRPVSTNILPLWGFLVQLREGRINRPIGVLV